MQSGQFDTAVYCTTDCGYCPVLAIIIDKSVPVGACNYYLGIGAAALDSLFGARRTCTPNSASPSPPSSVDTWGLISEPIVIGILPLVFIVTLVNYRRAINNNLDVKANKSEDG